MIPIVNDRPYRFTPPYPGTFWARVVRPLLPLYLRRVWGIDSLEFRGEERLAASLRAGHGVLLAPNHARPCDPMVVGVLPLRLGRPCHFVAASHVFSTGKHPRVMSWLLRRLGAFSIHRWGMDRDSLKASIQILTDARRPLLLFPEGIITRTNDRLNPLLEGTAFIARSAARNRAGQSPPGAVVVHPIAVRYLFQGDIVKSASAVLTEIEQRLTWQPSTRLPLIERVLRVGHGLLALKEVEYLGQAQTGSLRERLRGLAEAVLRPIEARWLTSGASIVERVKKLRTVILAELLETDLSTSEREYRWRCLADCYVTQQIDCYPGDYLVGETTVDRILETVERFEEDLTDRARTHPPMRAIVQVGEAIPVDAGRARSADEGLIRQVDEAVRGMLRELSRECRPFAPTVT